MTNGISNGHVKIVCPWAGLTQCIFSWVGPHIFLSGSPFHGPHILFLNFIFYYEDLQPEGDKQKLEDGAGALREAALSFHPQEAQVGDVGMVLLH